MSEPSKTQYELEIIEAELIRLHDLVLSSDTDINLRGWALGALRLFHQFLVREDERKPPAFTSVPATSGVDGRD